MKKTKGTHDKISGSVSYAMHSAATFFAFLYVFVMTVVFPFYLTNGYRNAGTDKSMMFRYWGLGLILSVLLCVTISLICIWADNSSKRPNIKACISNISISDKLILMYGLAVIVSFICSSNKSEAFWGAKGWYIGFATQMIYVVSYFCISRFLCLYNVLIVLMLISTAFTFVLGTLNRFSVYPIVIEGANPSFIATLGNINWFCGYWSVFFPMAAGLFYMSIIKKDEVRNRVILGIYLAVCAAAGAVQGSDSAMLVFVTVTLVLFWVSAGDVMHRSAFYMTMMIMYGACQVLRIIRVIFPDAMNYDSATAELMTGGNFTLILLVAAFILWILTDNVCKRHFSLDSISSYMQCERIAVLTVGIAALIIFVILLIRNTINPGSIGPLSGNPIFTFNEKWGSSRGITWTAGIKVFADMNFFEKIVGLGPDSFAYGVYREGSPAVDAVIAAFGNSRLTNAHNEWITVLVNTGIWGLITYIGFFVSKAVRYISKGVMLPAVFACGLSLVGYMSNNLFSFQQVLNGPFVFIMMGIAEAVIRDKNK